MVHRPKTHRLSALSGDIITFQTKKEHKLSGLLGGNTIDTISKNRKRTDSTNKCLMNADHIQEAFRREAARAAVRKGEERDQHRRDSSEVDPGSVRTVFLEAQDIHAKFERH